MASAEIGTNLEGDFAVLKTYLDHQFAKQKEFFCDLVNQHRMSHTLSKALAKPTSGWRSYSDLEKPPGDLGQNAPVQVMATQTSLPLSPIGERLQVQFSTNDMDVVRSSGTSGVSESHLGNHLGRRSARQSFVRSALTNQRTRAQTQAMQLTFARNRDDEETKSAPLTWRRQIEIGVRSSSFTNFIMLLIVGNAILLGVEIDVSSRVGQNDVPTWFGTVNAMLVFIFVTETVLKLLAVGCTEFWKGEECLWNTFDFVIVSLSVMETVIDFWAQTMSSSADGSNSFRIMRALRLARTLRGVRIIRVFRYFSALRGLILSIFSTMGSLLWTLLLLLILFYTFSCIFAQLVTDHCRFTTIDATGDPNAIPVCPELLDYYYGNVMDSMMTLFMSITGGINWAEAYVELRQVSPEMPVALWLMNLYIVIGFFTILNVVTGVFVNTAIESASADKDIATLKQMQKRLEQMSSLQEVFQEMDKGDINAVSLADLEDALQQNKLGTFMESLGISTDDVFTLFMLIDANHNGLVDLDEFVSGCMQLRGPAKSLQVAKMSYENKLTRQAIKHLHDDVAYMTKLMKQSLKYRLVRENM